MYYLCINILIILFIYFRKIKITKQKIGERGMHLELVKVPSSLRGIVNGGFKNVVKILNI